MNNRHVTLISIGLAMAMLSGCAASTSDAVEDDNVLVSAGKAERGGEARVGSRIRRRNDVEDGAAPAESYDRDSMRQSGATSLGEFLGTGSR